MTSKGENGGQNAMFRDYYAHNTNGHQGCYSRPYSQYNKLLREGKCNKKKVLVLARARLPRQRSRHRAKDGKCKY